VPFGVLFIAFSTENRHSRFGKTLQSDRPLKARVIVTLKPGILDPQGKAIEGALNSLDIFGVGNVRQGKIFEIELAIEDRAKAEALLKQASEKLLANLVIENYRIEILE
jgi:phosphoribosylformylglycinamidine synthase subunit PurS